MSVWDDIADTPREATELRIRAALMRTIRSRFDDLSESQVARVISAGLTQPCISDLLRGKISEFSRNDLEGIAYILDICVPLKEPQDNALTAYPDWGVSEPVDLCTVPTENVTVVPYVVDSRRKYPKRPSREGRVLSQT